MIFSTSPVRFPNAILCSSISALILASGVYTNAADGTWIRPTGTGSGLFSDASNWKDGIIASGADATAIFNFNPINDADGGIILDAPFTLGNLILNDTDGFGGASIGFNTPTGGPVQTITLDVSTAGAIPTITGGQLLNSQGGAAKKIVMNENLAGADGLLKNGPALLSIRGPSTTISGPLRIEGGSLEVRVTMLNISSIAITGGGSLNLDFGNAGMNTVDRFAPTTTLALGGAGGSGTLFENPAAATTTHSQSFAGVTVNAGGNLIVAATDTNRNMTYGLGTVTHNPGGALNFSKPTANGTGTFIVANPTGMLGSWATYNTGDWATVNAGLVGAFTGYTNDVWASGNQTNITHSGSFADATTATLRFNTGHSSIITLSGANTLTAGGIIAGQQAPVIQGGTLTSGEANGDLYIHSAAGGNLGLVLKSTITNNGATPIRIIKAGTGALAITADNTQTGGLYLGTGTVFMGSGPSGGSTGSVGGPITVSATNANVAQYIPNGLLAFNRAGTYTVTNDINPTVNAGGLIGQYSPGVLVLQKASKLGGVIAQQGTIQLNFNAASAPASQLIDGSYTTGGTTIHTARLTLRSGGLEVIGKDGTASQQNFALTDLQGRSKLVLKSGTGGTVTLDLGAINRANNSNDAGGTLAVTISDGSHLKINPGAASTLITDNGVAYVTVNGTDWGAKDLTNVEVVPGSSIENFYEATTPTSISFGNTDLATDDPVLTSAQQSPSIRVSKSTGPSTITLDGAGVDIGLGGLLVSSQAGANNVSVIPGPNGSGTLRAFNTGDRDLPLINYGTGTLTIGVPIINPSANGTHLVKSGPGDVALTAANTFTGRVFVTEGRLIVKETGTVGSSAARVNGLFIRNGELVIQDDAKVFSGNFSSIGQRAGDHAALTLKNNAVLDMAGDFNVGDVNSEGTLNISDNANFTVRNFFVAKFGYAVGTVNQSGGVLQAGNTPAADWRIGGNGAGDVESAGTFNLSGGTFDTGNQNFQVGAFGLGTFNQTGGTYRGTGFNVIGRFHSGVGTWNISGGTLDTTTTLAPGITPAPKDFFIVAEQGIGTLNVSGTALVTARNLSIGHAGGFGTVTQTGGTVDLTNTLTITGGLPAGVLFGQTTAPNPALAEQGGVYNLTGGTLRTFGIAERSGSPAHSAFNFNGGTVQAIALNSSFFVGLDEVNVFTGGAIVDTNGFDIGFSQPLTHMGNSTDGGLTKVGLGTLSLDSFNGYDGPTLVNAGRLKIGLIGGIASNVTINNSASLEVGGSVMGTILVGPNALLTGNGFIDGDVTVNGSIAAGPAVTTLSLTDDTLKLNEGSNSTFELGGAFQFDYDRLVGISQLTLAGTVNVVLTGGFQPAFGDSFDLLDFTSVNAAGFDIGTELVLPQLAGELKWNSSQFVTTGTLVVIPEPTSAIVLATGLALAVSIRRRRRMA